MEKTKAFYIYQNPFTKKLSANYQKLKKSLEEMGYKEISPPDTKNCYSALFEITDLKKYEILKYCKEAIIKMQIDVVVLRVEE